MIIEAIELLPKGIHPMAAFRTVVSLLGNLDPQQEDNSKEANRAKAVRMTAQFATIVAAQHRIAEGKPVVEPDLSLGHADNYLYMLNGERADADSVRTLDTAMNLYAEHEANASTFADPGRRRDQLGPPLGDRGRHRRAQGAGPRRRGRRRHRADPGDRQRRERQAVGGQGVRREAADPRLRPPRLQDRRRPHAPPAEHVPDAGRALARPRIRAGSTSPSRPRTTSAR